MNWKKLFEPHILERGYTYYCENAVENLEVSEDFVQADVIGTYDYEVEISLDKGQITDMYCSCPYAEDGSHCKHMAAVLFAWKEGKTQEVPETNKEDADLFLKAHTGKAYEKKTAAIRKLVEEADLSIVKEYLVSALAENEKLLIRFHNMVREPSAEESIERYIHQVDAIAHRYLGREQFISYYEAGDFISELEDILEDAVRRMINHKQYSKAFELMNYIFVLIGNVDMDDSDGETGMLADQIYQLWLELLTKVNADEKQEMFRWFTAHLDGSIIDYLEEYIEQIIMEEFKEKEYVQQKLLFVAEKIKEAEKMNSGWSGSYVIGKWALVYLSLLELQKCDKSEIENFCRKHWKNSSVRKYYIDKCVKAKEYEAALKTLDESMAIDKEFRGLVADYSQKKKEIYLLKGDKAAYVNQLWELVLNHEAGKLETYRELKKQYKPEEWVEKREEIFKKLPKRVRKSEFYKEEKLYDRLLQVVMSSSELYILEEYAGVLKKNYPEQILKKYKEEVGKMAGYAGGRQVYQEIVFLLRKMKKIKGGSKMVEAMVADWKVRYKNRPAMMDELGKL